MPLINFKTNLTSLKFGMDQPGGGDSGQPFIQAPIDNASATPAAKDLYQATRTALDFPIRGGALTSLSNGSYTTNAAIIDTDRIKKFFKSTPQGTTFIQKQKDLQLTNPKTQVPNSLQFTGVGFGNAVIPVTQVYNPANTLAQVAASGTGAHYNRQGVSPTIYESPRTTYQYIVGAPQNNTEVTNRLTILRALKLVGNTTYLIQLNGQTATGFGIDPLLIDRLGISPLQGQLFNYPGGPGSTYGVGFTRIFRYTNTDVTKTSQTNPDPLFSVNGAIAQSYSTIAFTYQQLAEQTTRSKGYAPTQAQIQDFRNQLPVGTARSDYKTKSLTRRLNIGNPGAPTNTDNYASSGSYLGIDQVNKTNPFYFDPTKVDPWTAGKNQGYHVDDMIKFAFECIDNDNPQDSVALVFRAFLEGTITDTNAAEYNSFKYLGRGETFRTYQGFNRTIGFSFRVFVQSRSEMLSLYQKVNQLISQVYPDYSPSYNLMRGNVVRLTIGDYIYRMAGFLGNVDITIDNANTPWEILLNDFPEDDVRQLPHMVSINCTFLPIMDLLPRKESKNNPFVPLIANKDQYLNPLASTAADKAKLLINSNTSTATTAANTAIATYKSPGYGNPPTVFTGRIPTITPATV